MHPAKYRRQEKSARYVDRKFAQTACSEVGSTGHVNRSTVGLKRMGQYWLPCLAYPHAKFIKCSAMLT